jgi:hypothetical protein
VSETMAQSNGFISSGEDGEEKPMLFMKKANNDVNNHGLAALINRQLQGMCMLNDKSKSHKYIVTNM